MEGQNKRVPELLALLLAAAALLGGLTPGRWLLGCHINDIPTGRRLGGPASVQVFACDHHPQLLFHTSTYAESYDLLAFLSISPLSWQPYFPLGSWAWKPIFGSCQLVSAVPERLKIHPRHETSRMSLVR